MQFEEKSYLIRIHLCIKIPFPALCEVVPELGHEIWISTFVMQLGVIQKNPFAHIYQKLYMALYEIHLFWSFRVFN